MGFYEFSLLCGKLYYFLYLSIKMKSKCLYARSRKTGKCNPGRSKPCTRGEDKSRRKTKAGLFPCKRKGSKSSNSKSKSKSKKVPRKLSAFQFLCLSTACNAKKTKGSGRGVIVTLPSNDVCVQMTKNGRTHQATGNCPSCKKAVFKFVSEQTAQTLQDCL